MAISGGTTLGWRRRTIQPTWQIPTNWAPPALAKPHRASWQRSYARGLALTDFIIVLVAIGAAQLGRFGQTSADLHIPGVAGPEFSIAYTVVSSVVVLAWAFGLHAHGTRAPQRIGSGWPEYRQVVDASLRVFGIVAIAAFLLHIDVARGYLLIAMPTGIALLVASRWAWRQWLGRQREHGRLLSRTVVLGEYAKTLHVARELLRDRTAGMLVIGAVTERRDGMLTADVPLVGSLDDALASIELSGSDAVVYCGSDQISPSEMRQLTWDLQSRNIELIVATTLTDVSGTRIHSRPVAGLSMTHVDAAKFSGARYVAKRAFDIVVSAAALVVLSPLLAMLALLIRRDGGPALFRQSRVGLDGRSFTMIKFRSMVVGAESMLPAITDASDGNGVLFKMRSDPRVTRLGRVLRRLSLDELPQLLNVLRGDMSLVGPRPPLISEVLTYEDSAHRRLLVKPGLTGLWQVSGRSDLSWEQSLRLDLYYVENWSLAADLVIIWRTLRAVTQREGAY